MPGRARAAGGREYGIKLDFMGMHGRFFLGPDGHTWEIAHIDASLTRFRRRCPGGYPMTAAANTDDSGLRRNDGQLKKEDTR